MFAIVQAGGRQETVAPGAIVNVDRLDAEPGGEVTFDKVLLISKDGTVTTGAPFIKGASVTGVVLSQALGKKVRVFKTKRRKQYRRTRGHRTQFTRVQVKDIQI